MTVAEVVTVVTSFLAVLASSASSSPDRNQLFYEGIQQSLARIQASRELIEVKHGRAAESLFYERHGCVEAMSCTANDILP